MIHKRSDLNQAQRDVVQRKQFSNLPYDDSIIFGRIQKEFEDRNFTVEEHAKDPDQDHHEFKLDQRVSKNDTIDFGWRQLGVMVPSLNPDDYAQRKTIDMEVVNDYIAMICEHVSSERAKENLKPSQVPTPAPTPVRYMIYGSGRSGRRPARTRSRSPATSTPGYRERDPLPTSSPSSPPPSPKPDAIACKMIPWEDVQLMTTDRTGDDVDDQAVIEALNNIGCTHDNYMELDYLFMPVFENENHVYLCGIAAKQRFAFVMDSYTKIEPDYRFLPFNLVIAILTHLIDGIYVAPGNIPDDPPNPYAELIPLFGMWNARSQTMDGSRDIIQQKDLYNCGAFTVTNAFCLAFGYELLCYTPEDMDTHKKPRICFEIMAGEFTGDYEYDLIEISQRAIVYPPPDEPSVPDDAMEQRGLPPTEEEERRKNQDQDEAGDKTDLESEGSDGEADGADWDSSRRFYTADEVLVRESPPVGPRPDTLPWPEQFGSKGIQRAMLSTRFRT